MDREPLIPFVVDVIDVTGSIVTFNLRPGTKLSVIYDAYKDIRGIKNVKLFLNGRLIKNSKRPVTTKLKTGDEIFAIYKFDEDEW